MATTIIALLSAFPLLASGIPVESDEERYGSQCTALREMREWQDFREGLGDEATAALAKSKKRVEHYMRSSEDSENAEAELDRSRSAHRL